MKSILSKVVIISFTLFIGILIGKYFFTQKSESNIKEIRKSFNYKFISPLLECNSNTADNNLTTLKNQVKNVINQEINQKNISFAAIYFRDLNNGPWFGINEKEYFTPASLIKVPVLITYYKLAEKNPEIFKQTIVNKEDQISGSAIQNIKPSEILTANQDYSIEYLINRMIINSDNDAYNDLVNNLNSDEIFQTYKNLDVDISKALTNPNGDILTVKDYASFFRILYNASYLDQDMSEKALNLLSQTTYKDGLAAGVPKNITISHKFGERFRTDTQEVQFHDCGIVYFPQKPYLLCVMTRGQNLNNATQTIKSISKIVYQYISQSNINLDL